jgi:hypothetical protein
MALLATILRVCFFGFASLCSFLILTGFLGGIIRDDGVRLGLGFIAWVVFLVHVVGRSRKTGEKLRW